MKNITIMKAYKRYVESLETINSPLFTDYKRVFEYLYEVDGDLTYYLFLDCICRTLKAIEKKQMHFKTSHMDWNKERVNEFFSLLNYTTKAYQRQDNEAFTVCFYKLFKCISEEELPNLQLYMFSKYNETEYGGKYLSSSSGIVKELLKCETEEEIDDCLKEYEEKKEEKVTPTYGKRFSNYSIPKVELFEMFNPKDLEETKECYAKLEEMADNCTISEEDYFYVKDILLSPRLTFYKRGGVYKEPSNSTNKLELEVIDGSSFEEEMEECLGNSK